jgi:heme/copper-type cytochrome/quinol oxidase subunit 2
VFAFLFAAPFLVTHSPKATQSASQAPQPRVIEVTADHDSQYRIHGQTRQVITVTAAEPLVLRITAIKAKSHNRDGSVHGFSLLHAKSRQLVPGWDFLLHPGMNEFSVTAPAEPGDYEVVCTVICSDDHEQMNMKFVVLPSGG